MYLVDTNVISAGAPMKTAHPELVHWMEARSEALYLSVVTVAEIEAGIAKARRDRATRKAVHLSAWLETMLHLYGDRILIFDIAVAHIAGRLSDLARGQGRAPGFADIVTAATAAHRGFTVLTRNLRDFRPLGVPAVDPFAGLPR
jgi:toxin FitB